MEFQWTEQCEIAFQELKHFLATPLILTKPKLGEELLLYLSIIESALNVVLVREEDRTQQLIYFVSRVLQGPELRY